MEGGVHRHRPAGGERLQLLHEEGVPVGHLLRVRVGVRVRVRVSVKVRVRVRVRVR